MLYQSVGQQGHVDSVEGEVLGAWRDAPEERDEVCGKTHWEVLEVSDCGCDGGDGRDNVQMVKPVIQAAERAMAAI